ncbi:MAG: DUF4160 domain-containing protein [Myxococcota bacterium]
MPTVLRIGPYRFFFYSDEGVEPAHIHVQRDRALAKFWLTSVSLASSYRYSGRELRYIEALVHEHRALFQEAWDGHFGG